MSDLILMSAGGEICSLAQEIDGLAESMMERVEGTSGDAPKAIIDATFTHIVLLAHVTKRLAKLVDQYGEVVQEHPTAFAELGAASGEKA